MKIIKNIRLDNARRLAAEVGGQAGFIEKLKKSQPQVSALIGENPTKNIGNQIAREIENAFGKEPGWLDAEHKKRVVASLTTKFGYGTDDAGMFELLSAYDTLHETIQGLHKEFRAIRSKLESEVFMQVTDLLDDNEISYDVDAVKGNSKHDILIDDSIPLEILLAPKDIGILHIKRRFDAYDNYIIAIPLVLNTKDSFAIAYLDKETILLMSSPFKQRMVADEFHVSDVNITPFLNEIPL